MHARTSSAISPSRRNLVVASSVVLFHVAALWALQSGLLHRVSEVFVPVEIVTEIITPPAVRPQPPAPPPPKPAKAPEPAKPVQVHKPAPPPPAPKLVAPPEPRPAPNAPTGVAAPQPAPAPVTAPVAAVPVPSPAPAPAAPRVELPVSNADYLHNPKPAYPPASRRLGEKGKVVLRVLIGADGTAQDATVFESSGYDRLDRAALQAVLTWRYVPGKRGGVPEPMWVKVPINFDFSQ